MKDVPKAAFSFDGYQIPEFSLSAPSSGTKNISIGFSPKGLYNENTGSFTITLKYIAYDKEVADDTEGNGSEFITATMIANFGFADMPRGSELPGYFYRNSIAIIYPYLRAFVTNLTIQAMIKPLIMPLLNLTAIEKELMENTQFVRIGGEAESEIQQG